MILDCKVCQERKDCSDFYRKKSNKTGFSLRCKDCMRAIARIKDAEYRRKNREKYNKKRNAWRRENKHKKNALNANYRIRKRKASFTLTDKQKEELHYFYWLAQDLRATTGEKYEVDHILPLQGDTVCGLHVPWNLQVIPAYINRYKSNRQIGDQT